MLNPLSDNLLKLIQESEGISLSPYFCPAGNLTIGYGHVIVPEDFAFFGIEKDRLKTILKNNRIPHDIIISLKRATELLKKDVSIFSNALINNTKVKLNQNQHDAIVDFMFNVGVVSYNKSTLKKLVDAGDFEGASKQFEKWVYATVNGKKTVLNGLVTRRQKEKELFLLKVA